jgi:hypothetical protein
MDYSISIGIDFYLNLKTNTPYSENDAKAFNDIMKEVFNISHNDILLGSESTFTNINHSFDKVKNKINKEDRFFFFYAGHGKNYHGVPHLSCFDSNDYKIHNSWINVQDLIEKINSTGCNRSLYFLDSCESTLKLGSRMETLEEFSLQQKLKLKRESEYTYVFSSTSHKELADINEEKKHGIWSYFLLKALSGKDKNALEGRQLTNSSLSLYLKKNVEDYCKRNTKSNVIQHSYTWGKCQTDFLIKEFKPEKVELYKDIPKTKIKNIEFITIKFTGVKSLSGFNKSVHTIPKYYNDTSNHFIQKIAHDELNIHIKDITLSLKKLLGLNSRDYESGVLDSCAYFRSAYLRYEYCVNLNESDLSQVSFSSSLIPLDINKIIAVSKSLDQCFPAWFNKLLFTLSKPIDIEQLIIDIEESDLIQEIFNFEFEYDKSSLTLNDKNSGRDIIIKSNVIEINFKVLEKIPSMLKSLKEISNQLALLPHNYKLLN